MRFQFDPNKQHQLDAIEAVSSLFQGQPKTKGFLGPNEDGESSRYFGLNCVRNSLDLHRDDLAKNVSSVQQRSDLRVTQNLEKLDFSIEMETGTGKTYIYLRTIEELHNKYGLKKFIIVVPSLAIREGVSKTAEITEKHFDAIYGNRRREFRKYSSDRLSDISHFLSNDALEILLLNIDSFNKDSNKINQAIGGFGGVSGRETLAMTRPIVILDEPQNLEGESAKSAIESLKPLAVFRYSATHRNYYNLIHRLTPVDAYMLRLVKRIEVLSVVPEADPSTPYVRLISFASTRKTINAKIEINSSSPSGVIRKRKTVSAANNDLFELSGGLSAYKDLYITSIDISSESLELSNGLQVTIDEALTDVRSQMKKQIEETIREHLEKELAVERYFVDEEKPKVLSLFFIDRVDNYVPDDSFLRETFEESYSSLSGLPRYSALCLPKAIESHGGYFSAVKGLAKDTNGRTRADQDTFELIMKDKERLLSLEEPIRFIFSHSALREGWDNPNVFQICTLNQSKSTIKKRQEIGRGMRLPVNQIGVQIKDPAINILTVIANESYADFAKALQTEIEQDSGVKFEGAIGNRRRRVEVEFNDDWKSHSDLRNLWHEIARPTHMQFTIDSLQLINEAVSRLKKSPPIQKPKIITSKAKIEIDRKGVTGQLTSQRSASIRGRAVQLPNLVYELQQHCGVSRRAVSQIMQTSGRLPDFLINPDVFLNQAKQAISSALQSVMSSGVSYVVNKSRNPSVDDLSNAPQAAYLDRCVSVSKSPFNYIPCDSLVERGFVETLDAREDISVIVKLPTVFCVDTPLGEYWPDWAIVKRENGENRLYLVRETKSNWDKTGLRQSESIKIDCASKHFRTIGANFAVVTDAAQV